MLSALMVGSICELWWCETANGIFVKKLTLMSSLLVEMAVFYVSAVCNRITVMIHHGRTTKRG